VVKQHADAEAALQQNKRDTREERRVLEYFHLQPQRLTELAGALQAQLTALSGGGN
jgi:hypothetical protein